MLRPAVVGLVLLAAAVLGQRASMRYLALGVVVLGALALLRQPRLGLLLLVAAALIFRLEFGTGTEVSLNPVTLLVPVVLAIWVLSMVVRGRVRPAPSSTNRPLVLFVLAGLLSLLVGIATWDPLVPRRDSFLLVQLAQWAIFALSAGAFWLSANLIVEEKWLRRMTFLFLWIAGGFTIARHLPGLGSLTDRFTTLAFTRAPLWILLTSLAAGQLLFNTELETAPRLGLAAIVVSSLVYTFVEQQEVMSNWLGLGVALAVLFWLRFPRLRVPVVIVVGLLALSGILFPSVYAFAGGDQEWALSGSSRLTLIGRVLSVTRRNPITGLGPAAYRLYASMEPLAYGKAYWLQPQVNSHNNYVDMFAHTGLLGLALFAWFVVELLRRRPAGAAQTAGGLSRRLHQRHPCGDSCLARADDVGRLDPALRVQHRLSGVPGQRPGMAVHGRTGGHRQHEPDGDRLRPAAGAPVPSAGARRPEGFRQWQLTAPCGARPPLGPPPTRLGRPRAHAVMSRL